MPVEERSASIVPEILNFKNLPGLKGWLHQQQAESVNLKHS
ncbi:MAG: hypothetical protein WAK48_02895 [Candidatus Acidiferrum sp.]|jgi:hypothetical protein